jgi:hypothetical protein
LILTFKHGLSDISNGGWGCRILLTHSKSQDIAFTPVQTRDLSVSWHGIDWFNQGLLPFPPDAQERIEIPGFPPILPIDLPGPFKQGAANAKFPVQGLVANFKKLKEATMVLVNTVDELESGIIVGLQKFHESDSKQDQVGSTFHAPNVFQKLFPIAPHFIPCPLPKIQPF